MSGHTHQKRSKATRDPHRFQPIKMGFAIAVMAAATLVLFGVLATL